MTKIPDKKKNIFGFQIEPKTILIAFLVWTVLGLTFALRAYAMGVMNNADFPIWGYITQTLVDFYIYALATPLIFRLQTKFPLKYKHLARSIPFHLIVSAIFTVTSIVLSVFTVYMLGLTVCKGCYSMQQILTASFTHPPLIHQGLLIYWGIVAVGQGLEYYKGMRNEQFRVAELSAQLSDARLNALKMQIHPHFLFNTLNSIASLIHEDVEVADLMLNRLSDFLRMTLNSSGEQIVMLKTELNFLNTYLEIEKVRFSERLKVEILADESVLSAKLPNFILQPIVENSIKHGLADKKTNCLLKISAQRAANRLLIEITDNGKGLDDEIILATDSGNGLGLSNTLARLKQTYNDDFTFEIKGQKNKGTVVKFDLPFTD